MVILPKQLLHVYDLRDSYLATVQTEIKKLV